MNLVDSCGWLAYFADDANADYFAPAILDNTNLIVSTINIYEVFKTIVKQRNENAAYEAITLMLQANIIDVNSSIALSATRISLEYNLPMADSLILATARTHHAKLWTQDAHFKNITEVNYIEFSK